MRNHKKTTCEARMNTIEKQTLMNELTDEMPISDCSQTVDEYVWAFHLTIKNQIIFK